MNEHSYLHANVSHKTFWENLSDPLITETGCFQRKSEVSYRDFYMYRSVYQLIHGPQPKGLNICHRCDNRLCFNPAHLWLGTQKENIQDASTKMRLTGNRGKIIPRRTEKEVRDMRALHDTGKYTMKEIAEKFGKKRVDRYINDPRWRD